MLDVTNSNNKDYDEFLRLLLVNRRRIYSYILKYVLNMSDAEDIMQETVSIMWRKFDQFEAGTAFGAWGVAIAKNEVLKLNSKAFHSKVLYTPEVADFIEQHRTTYSDSTQVYLESLKTCMEKLPENDRRMIQMQYEHGLTIKAIAEKINQSVHVLYKKFSRIHRSLMQCVNKTVAAEGRR